MENTSKRNVCDEKESKIRITEAKVFSHNHMHTHKKQSIFQYYLAQVRSFNDFRQIKTAACIHYPSVQPCQLYYLRITGVTLPPFSISRTPLKDGQLESVPMVSVLERVHRIKLILIVYLSSCKYVKTLQPLKQ